MRLCAVEQSTLPPARAAACGAGGRILCHLCLTRWLRFLLMLCCSTATALVVIQGDAWYARFQASSSPGHSLMRKLSSLVRCFGALQL